MIGVGSARSKYELFYIKSKRHANSTRSNVFGKYECPTLMKIDFNIKLLEKQTFHSDVISKKTYTRADLLLRV